MKLYRRFSKYIDLLTKNANKNRLLHKKGTAHFSLYFFKGVTVQYVITRQIHSNGPILKIFIQITLNTI